MMYFLPTCVILILISFPNIVSSAVTSQERLNQIADAYEKAYFERHPEMGLHWGKSGVDLDRFMDHSMNAYIQWQKKEDNFFLRLKKINVSELKDTPQYQTYCLLKERLESNRAIRICKSELWNVNPLWGWHNILSMIADKQPIGTAEYRQYALKRWKNFDRVVQDEINNLKLGIKEGYTAPKPAVKAVLNQLKIIVNLPTEESPYFDFAKRDSDPVFKKQIADVVETIINPALKNYIYYLENEYLPLARTQIGVSALPNGMQCYMAKIRENTTLSLSPQVIYDYGVEQREKLSSEISEIGLKEFGIKDPVEIFRLANERTKYSFRSEQDILEFNQAALSRMKAEIHYWFSMLPKTKEILKPYPLHRAKTGAGGEYDRPNEDGSRPGIFYINTYDPKNKNKIGLESILFHELIPGHHFQISLAMENRSRHHLDQYLWNDGFEEGWALYSERLADEMGLYESNMSRIGMLSNESFRTARLVIDPGIHVMQWTREQAITYLKKHTILEEHIIEGEIDRYIMLPAQATSYMLGKREIDSLRQTVEAKLGDKFDIKEYHYQILKNGSVTLPMLRENIEQWLSDKSLAIQNSKKSSKFCLECFD